MNQTFEFGSPEGIDPDLWEQIMRDGAEEEARTAARFQSVGPQLERRYREILQYCRRFQSGNRAEEQAQEVFRRFLRELHLLWDSRPFSYESPDGEIITLQPIEDPERAVFREDVSHWTSVVAKNLFLDEIERHKKNAPLLTETTNPIFAAEARLPNLGRHAIAHSLDTEEPQRGTRTQAFVSAIGPVERRLVSVARATEIRNSYVAALDNLNMYQRAVWLLCRDELLMRDQLDQLMKPLHWATARVALRTKGCGEERCLLADEAARVLGRNASTTRSDIADARNILASELSDFDPFKAWRSPAPRWGREFLLGKMYSAPLAVSMHPQAFEWSLERFLANVPRNLAPVRQQEDRIELRATNNFSSETISRKQRRSGPCRRHRIELDRYSFKCGSWYKGCMNCGDWVWRVVRINNEFRNVKRYKSGFNVRRAYSPGSQGWTFWCYECGAKDESCWEDSCHQLGTEATRGPKDDSIQAYKA